MFESRGRNARCYRVQRGNERRAIGEAIPRFFSQGAIHGVGNVDIYRRINLDEPLRQFVNMFRHHRKWRWSIERQSVTQ